MRHPFILLIVLSVSLFACKAANVSQAKVIPDGIQFDPEVKFENILAKAKADNKLVFVEFYADWCAPCKLMEKEVFSNKAIGDFFNEHFINVKVDTEKRNGPDLAAIFQVNALPTLLFLDDIGRVVERREGAAFHSDLMRMADSAMSQKESTTYIEIQQ